MPGSTEMDPAAGSCRPEGREVVAHLAPALLAALIAVQTFGAGERVVVDARALGLAAGGAALALRVPSLPAVAIAAAVTAVTAVARALA